MDDILLALSFCCKWLLHFCLCRILENYIVIDILYRLCAIFGYPWVLLDLGNCDAIFRLLNQKLANQVVQRRSYKLRLVIGLSILDKSEKLGVLTALKWIFASSHII